jgi:hypothetical protein
MHHLYHHRLHSPPFLFFFIPVQILIAVLALGADCYPGPFRCQRRCLFHSHSHSLRYAFLPLLIPFPCGNSYLGSSASSFLFDPMGHAAACTFTIFSFPCRFPCACVHAHVYAMYVQSTSLGRDKVRVCYCQIVILTVGLYGGHEPVARAGFNGLGLGSLLIGCFQITLLPSLQYIL